jgi:hypothetical protein
MTEATPATRLAEVVDAVILPILEACLVAGFTIWALKETRPPYKIGFAYVSLQDNGPYATVQVPTHKWEDASLDVPIKPSREYGSGVLVDYDGTVPGAVEALRKACSEPNVTVRFVAKRGQAAPVVPNYGSNAVTKWQGGVESFHVFRPAS